MAFKFASRAPCPNPCYQLVSSAMEESAPLGCKSSERFILYNTGLVLCVTKSPILVSKHGAESDGSQGSEKLVQIDNESDNNYTYNYYVLSPNAKQIAIFYTDNSVLNKVIHLTKYIPTKYRSITVKIVKFRNRYCKRFPFLFERLYESSKNRENQIFSNESSSADINSYKRLKALKLNLTNKASNEDAAVVTEMTLLYDEEDSSLVDFKYSVCDFSRRDENDFNDYNYIYNITNDIVMSNNVMYTDSILTTPKNSISKAVASIISRDVAPNDDGSYDVALSDIFELDDEHDAITAADVSSLFTEAFAEAPMLRNDHMYAVSCGCAVVEMLNGSVFFLNGSLAHLVDDEYTVETDVQSDASLGTAVSICLKNEIFTLRKRSRAASEQVTKLSFHLVLLQNYCSSKDDNDYSSAYSMGCKDAASEGSDSLEDFLGNYSAHCVRLLSLRNHIHSRKHVLVSYNGTIEQNRKYKHFINSSTNSCSNGNGSKPYYNSYDNKYFDVINYNIFADENLTKTIKTHCGSQITVIRNISNSSNHNGGGDKDNIEIYKMNNEYNISSLFSYVRGSFIDSESSGAHKSILTIDLKAMSVTGILSSGCLVTTTVKDCIDHNNRFSDLDINIFGSGSSSSRNAARDKAYACTNSMNLRDMKVISKHVIEMLNFLNFANYGDEKMAALCESTRQITKKNSNIVENSVRFLEINKETTKSFSKMHSRIVGSTSTSFHSDSDLSSPLSESPMPTKPMDRARMMEIMQSNKKQIFENKSFVDNCAVDAETLF